MKKLTKTQIRDLENKIGAEYPIKELGCIYEAVLHLETTLFYMRTKEGKDAIINANIPFGGEEDEQSIKMAELKYEDELIKMERSLTLRKAELKVLKEYLCK